LRTGGLSKYFCMNGGRWRSGGIYTSALAVLAFK